MAHGRPDYWNPYTIGLPFPSIEQILWYQNGFGVGAAGGFVSLAGYDVLVNTVLYITRVLVSTDAPGTQRFQILIGGINRGTVYYDISGSHGLGVSAILEAVFGQDVWVRCYNDDDIPHSFAAIMFGFTVGTVSTEQTPGGFNLPLPGSGV